MATYYVDGAVGNDGNLGDDEGAGNAWATIAHAFSTRIGGDTIYIKSSVDYNEAVIPTVGGGTSAPITVIGYDTTIDDGGKVTMDGDSSLTSAMSGAYLFHHVFRNIIFTNYTSHGFTTTGDYVLFRDCEFTSNGGAGCIGDDSCTFIGCKISGNTSYGLDTDTRSQLVGCEISNNGSYGVLFTLLPNVAYNCVFVGNTTYQIYGNMWVFNCVIDGTADSSGFYMSSTCRTVVNSIIYDNYTGLYALSATYAHTGVGLNNLVNSNSTEDYSASWPARCRESDITDPPGFTDEAGGDYTLASTSAARNAGADASGTSSPGMDIGAHQSEDAGGGAARVIITG